MNRLILKRFMSSTSTSAGVKANIGNKTKNIVIVGGSWAGFTLGRNLYEAPDVNVMVIEKSPYHAHNFIFPRFCVYGHNMEALAFIPLDKRRQGIPPMIFDECVSTSEDHVTLKSGQQVPYDILVIATGVSRTLPAGLSDDDNGGVIVDMQQHGVAKLRRVQAQIQEAKEIAVIGAGAVGVELATDIKFIYKDSKNVTLYNSRDRILPRFHESVHEFAEPELSRLGVRLVNNTRPIIKDDHTIVIPHQKDHSQKDHHQKKYDLVFNCTGQSPNSQPFKRLLGNAVLPSGSIKVSPTLQVLDRPNIFAIGDVSSRGPQMAKAARAQADLATTNILNYIQQKTLAEYIPVPREAGLHLTLGFNRSLYNTGDNTRIEDHPMDYILKTPKAWDRFGVDDRYKPKNCRL